MTASTPRVMLREFRSTDAPAIVRLGDDRDVWRNLRDRFPHPYTEDAARQWLDFVASQAEALASGGADAARRAPGCYRAIEVDGEFAGGIGCTRRTDVERFSAEVGYWLGRPFWNRGVASAALSLFVRHVYATTDLLRLDALVFATNPASCRVLEKCGFAFEGTMRRAIVKDGAVLDARLYAILRTS